MTQQRLYILKWTEPMSDKLCDIYSKFPHPLPDVIENYIGYHFVNQDISEYCETVLAHLKLVIDVAKGKELEVEVPERILYNFVYTNIENLNLLEQLVLYIGWYITMFKLEDPLYKLVLVSGVE